MEWFDLTLKVRSALGTPLSADTLFGHLCWDLRWRQGEGALTDFLAAYDAGDPPLLLSDPFPEGFWPMPTMPRPAPDQQRQLEKIIQSEEKAKLTKNLPDCRAVLNMTGSKPTATETFDILKWLLKLRWLPEAVLEATADQLSSAAILSHFLEKGCGQPTMPVETVVPHNTINRLTGTTGDENSFFFTRELHINPTNPPVFHMLTGSAVYTQDQIRQWFESALAAGYGKYKSRGKGRVTAESIRPITLPKAQKPNAVMLLAACIPAANDPADGYWRLSTKFGKLGGDWAVGPHPSGRHNPYKKPVTMLKAGAVLKTDSPRPFYGRLAAGVHTDFPEVRHYGLSPAIPVCYEFTEVV